MIFISNTKLIFFLRNGLLVKNRTLLEWLKFLKNQEDIAEFQKEMRCG
jgi:hypothetical protein